MTKEKIMLKINISYIKKNFFPLLGCVLIDVPMYLLYKYNTATLKYIYTYNTFDENSWIVATWNIVC